MAASRRTEGGERVGDLGLVRKLLLVFLWGGAVYSADGGLSSNVCDGGA